MAPHSRDPSTSFGIPQVAPGGNEGAKRGFDGSGTTYIWTNYLAKVSEDWDKVVGFGTSVPWPVGVGAQGNSGVAALVRQTPYSIGYVELSYAIQSKLPYGSVKNQAGNFVKADLQSVTAAAASVAQKMEQPDGISAGDDLYICDRALRRLASPSLGGWLCAANARAPHQYCREDRSSTS